MKDIVVSEQGLPSSLDHGMFMTSVEELQASIGTHLDLLREMNDISSTSVDHILYHAHLRAVTDLSDRLAAQCNEVATQLQTWKAAHP
jgi:hypothetical protein